MHDEITLQDSLIIYFTSYTKKTWISSFIRVNCHRHADKKHIIGSKGSFLENSSSYHSFNGQITSTDSILRRSSNEVVHRFSDV